MQREKEVGDNLKLTVFRDSGVQQINTTLLAKERMKAMRLIMQCCYKRSKLINSEAFNRVFRLCRKVKSDEEAVRIGEQEISRREKALQSYLQARKLTMDEFYDDPDKSDRVF